MLLLDLSGLEKLSRRRDEGNEVDARHDCSPSKDWDIRRKKSRAPWPSSAVSTDANATAGVSTSDAIGSAGVSTDVAAGAGLGVSGGVSDDAPDDSSPGGVDMRAIEPCCSFAGSFSASSSHARCISIGVASEEEADLTTYGVGFAPYNSTYDEASGSFTPAIPMTSASVVGWLSNNLVSQSVRPCGNSPTLGGFDPAHPIVGCLTVDSTSSYI